MGHVEARSSLEVVPGMQVVSSGLDPEIPFGLVIGTVETAEVSADSDLWQIRSAAKSPVGILSDGGGFAPCRRCFAIARLPFIFCLKALFLSLVSAC